MVMSSSQLGQVPPGPSCCQGRARSRGSGRFTPAVREETQQTRHFGNQRVTADGQVFPGVAYPFHCRVSASSVDLVETRRRPPGPVLWRLGEAGGS